MGANPFTLPWTSSALDSYHRYVLSTVFANARGSVSLDFFQFMISDFQQSLDYLKSLPKKLPGKGTFQQQIFLVESQDVYYKLDFDIPLIEKYIQENGIGTEMVSPTNSKIFSDPDNLEEIKMNYYLQDDSEIIKPIITVYHPYIHTEIVIDGNHRIAKAISKRILQIPAYRLNSAHLFRVLANDKLSQGLYLYHHNLMTFYDSEYNLYRKISDANPEAPTPSRTFLKAS